MTDKKRPSITESVGRVLSRGNMRQRETSCDLDVVGALGFVGIREKLADAVFRLKYSNDAKSYGDALAGVRDLARAIDVRLHWKMRRRGMNWMARRVLDYWLNDGCRLCTGLGYEVPKGTPHLSDRPCVRCHGTKKQVMPWLRRVPNKPEGRRSHGRVKRWYEVCRRMNNNMAHCRLLLIELERTERELEGLMRTRLARAA